MATGTEMVISTLRMLDERYDETHNTTVQLVLEKHLSRQFIMGDAMRRRTARSMAQLLNEHGVLRPKNSTDDPRKATLWEVDLSRCRELLKELERKAKEGGGIKLRVDPPRHL